MKSSYIPQSKQPVKEPLLTRIRWFFHRSFYVGKVKVTIDSQGGLIYKFGVTIYPQYKQFELNFGRMLINFWYRN